MKKTYLSKFVSAKENEKPVYLPCLFLEFESMDEYKTWKEKAGNLLSTKK